MAQTFLDEPYVVTTILNRVFNDQSPSNAVYNNQVAKATSVGVNAFALSFGASFTPMRHGAWHDYLVNRCRLT